MEAKLEGIASRSVIAQKIETIPGFGAISKVELAAEIGTIDRFEDEGSLALYLGMATLDNSSGKQKGTKTPKERKRGQALNVDKARPNDQ
jgi:transposase